MIYSSIAEVTKILTLQSYSPSHLHTRMFILSEPAVSKSIIFHKWILNHLLIKLCNPEHSQQHASQDSSGRTPSKALLLDTQET